MLGSEPQEVLIVDDSPDVHDVLEARLRGEGFRIRHALDADTASALARERRPDLLLLDLDLGGRSGLDLWRELSADPALATVPVIVLTSTMDLDVKLAAFEAGVVDYVGKACDEAELRARVRVALRAKRTPEPTPSAPVRIESGATARYVDDAPTVAPRVGPPAGPPERDPFIGRVVLGKYRVERQLGAGGMGAVYLMRHDELQDAVAAVKVMRSEVNQTTKERFRQEALVAAALGGQRVVRPIDVGQFDDGIPYIAMEYVHGRSLAEELQTHDRLPLVTALQVAARVADTMRVAHEKDIVHRDLKPANIMLTQDEGTAYGVRLLDFGIARASGAMKVAHTREGTPIGSPGYMSPEQAAGMPVDGRTDVFAIGVILYRMLTSRLPFAGDTVRDLMAGVLDNAPAPTLRQRLPTDAEPPPEAVERLVARALAKEVEDRPSMAELHEALIRALEEIAGPDPMNVTDARAARMSEQIGTAAPGAGAREGPTLSEAQGSDKPWWRRRWR